MLSSMQFIILIGPQMKDLEDKWELNVVVYEYEAELVSPLGLSQPMTWSEQAVWDMAMQGLCPHLGFWGSCGKTRDSSFMACSQLIF